MAAYESKTSEAGSSSSSTVRGRPTVVTVSLRYSGGGGGGVPVSNQSFTPLNSAFPNKTTLLGRCPGRVPCWALTWLHLVGCPEGSCSGGVRPGSSMSEQQQQQSASSVGRSGHGTKDDLEAGSSTHRGERKFVCQQCDKTFTSRIGLRQHILRHSGVRNYECQECGKKFITKSELTRHTLTHSGVRNYYECLQCGKKFTTKGYLTTHTLTHSGVRNYECLECGKKFTRKECGKKFFTIGDLNRHAFRHTGLREFKCDVCGKCFKTKVFAARHSQVKHAFSGNWSPEGVTKALHLQQDVAGVKMAGKQGRRWCVLDACVTPCYAGLPHHRIH
ncbi:zinc finger protein 37A-like [Portunus trituberculatus]|uniref:zinc finger protein 37A-like n=1 Tax=Portunus trituberculatus TaxID=210409 RepID=UPI001E1CD946|nr:zinc finger protein 37A-like [Portunus trituberculatus]